jgi:hypothetical protein
MVTMAPTVAGGSPQVMVPGRREGVLSHGALAKTTPVARRGCAGRCPYLLSILARFQTWNADSLIGAPEKRKRN